MKIAPYTLTATEAVQAIASGRLSSVDLVKSCLEQIADTDASIKAWAHLDPESALAQAAECDRIRKAGLGTGPLHGLPVGLKDVIDTRDMPTQRGTDIFKDRQPDKDARLVERLRESGAVIMGKTVTTELAFVHANDTRNPHNPEHSPGGSSSGSAAAVAACHVPLAVGTQTNGSVIRPASFCGTFGFKPTRGVISRAGVLKTSDSLDQVGCFGRSLEDVALLTDALAGYDQADSCSFARPRPQMRAGAQAEAPVAPDLVWFNLPFYDRLSPDAHEGMEAVLDVLGPRITRMAAADTLANLVAVQARIHEYEICQHQAAVFDANFEDLSRELQLIVARGRKISEAEYTDALAVKASAQTFFDELFVEFDAIIAPCATGEAPKFGSGTGDPIFCTLWTLAGLPCVSLPLLVGDNNLPIGVQLIGPIEKDDRLLRTARWLQLHLAQAT
ncbi:MAG: amidase [Planktomarina temperata]|uniref:amidase n=2 Tax=Paracoccaceae TaxID=31989 RepID=UPI000147507D|nr:amidase [Planktomarina temperata]MDC3275579.1 amidase [bacterium]MDA7455427.1 amidase [Planktomarina temperata]MDA7475112.1 amidase [Planktomarina temperata]MDA7483277.1 amidase [Planktomarina temperata]